MRASLLAATAILSIAAMSPASATVTIDILNNGSLIGTATGVSSADFSSTTLPGYSDISVSAAGFPIVPGGDLTSTTLDVSSTSSTAQNLSIQIFQTGVHVPAPGDTRSTFTVNGLIGSPGPTITSTFWGGTNSTLGTQLTSASFPAGDIVAHAGPNFAAAGQAFTSDAQQYAIHFSGGVQSENGTIELSTAIPEPSTWAMLVLGFMGLIWVGHRKRTPTALFG